MARRRRELRPEERELWQAVAQTARPMHEASRLEASASQSHVLPQSEGIVLPKIATAKAKTSPATTVAQPAAKPPLGTKDDLDLFDFAARMLAGFRAGSRAKTEAKVTLPNPAPTPLRMDARTHQKLTRGKLAPEARIDLHGMTLAEAHPELIAFLYNAQSAGKRLVLVITGKGKQIEEPVLRPIGALRHQVPHWLRLAPLNGVVQQVEEAHLRHGGAGAFYIWLRRL